MTSFIPVSFEFFPPKTAQGHLNLCHTANQLLDCQPTFFSVTFGAGGSTRQGTLDAIALLQEKTAVPIAAHLACLGSTREEISTLLHLYKSMGIKRLVALRGDLPTDVKKTGELFYAVELVDYIRKTTGYHFHIEVAAYPEFHPQAKKTYDDLINLKRKYEAGANSAITQYFFNADAYFYFREDCDKIGIKMPIIPGIMPITHFDKLIRFSALCGAEIPRWIIKRLESYQDDEISIKNFGTDVIYSLCEQLIQGGAPGLHFYTLNQAEASLSLCQLLINKNTCHTSLDKKKIYSL